MPLPDLHLKCRILRLKVGAERYWCKNHLSVSLKTANPEGVSASGS
jgi:hypothetical protein